MKHILFVDANVNGLLAVDHALRCGHRVSFFEPDDVAWYGASARNESILARVHERQRVPREAMLDAILALDSRVKLDAVVCIFERSLDIAAQACEALGLRGPAAAAVLQCRDKQGVRESLSSHGLANVRHAAVSSLEETLAALVHVGLPAVIKPRYGAGSMMCALLRHPSDVEVFWRNLDASAGRFDAAGPGFVAAMREGFVVESYLTGDMVSAEIASAQKEHAVLMLSERVRSSANELVDYRINMPAALDIDVAQACIDYACRALDAVGLSDGIFHVELILTEEGPVCVEINPRLMGGYMPLLYNHVSGRNVYEDLLKIHLLGRLPDDIGTPAHWGAAVRFEAAQSGTFDLRGLLDSVAQDRQAHPFIEHADIPAGLTAAQPGQVLARLQVLAQSRAKLDERVEELFDSLGTESSALLLR